jgi:hypothetical protein
MTSGRSVIAKTNPSLALCDRITSIPTDLNRRQSDLVILGSSSTKRILGDELELVTAGASSAPQGRRLLVQVSLAIDG